MGHWCGDDRGGCGGIIYVVHTQQQAACKKCIYNDRRCWQPNRSANPGTNKPQHRGPAPCVHSRRAHSSSSANASHEEQKCGCRRRTSNKQREEQTTPTCRSWLTSPLSDSSCSTILLSSSSSLALDALADILVRTDAQAQSGKTTSQVRPPNKMANTYTPCYRSTHGAPGTEWSAAGTYFS